MGNSRGYKNIKKIGLGIIAFEGTEHLYNIIYALRNCVDYVAVGLQRVSYHGEPISATDLAEIYRLRDEDHIVDEILEIELDPRKKPRVQETDKRNILIQDAEDHGCSHAIVIDSDEYYTRKSFERAVREIDENDYEMTYCQYVNYGMDYEHVLVYPFSEGMYVPFVSKTKYRHSFECSDFPLPSDPTRRYVRPYDSVRKHFAQDGSIVEEKHYTVGYHVFPWETVHMNHLSWMRADIRKKLESWSSKTLFENYDDVIDQSVVTFERFDADAKKGRLKMLFNTPGNNVDVMKLDKQYIHPKVDYRTRLRKKPDYKRVLFLSMSADCEPFRSLEKACDETWRSPDLSKYPNVKAEFWTYTDAAPGEKTSVDPERNVIYVERDGYYDTPINSTYSKTIEALSVIEAKGGPKYDWLVRTNDSTWLNVPLLCEFLAYADNDSMRYGAQLYGAFWSAFNPYAGGECMVFSKRDVGLLLRLAGGVSTAKEFERRVFSCDDNMVCGKFNERAIRLGLPHSEFWHSLGKADFIGRELDPRKVDFSIPAIQVKTYDATPEERAEIDCRKMRELDRMWRASGTADAAALLKEMKERHYDKTVDVLPESKKEWVSARDFKAKFRPAGFMERRAGLEFLKNRQKELGYTEAPFF